VCSSRNVSRNGAAADFICVKSRSSSPSLEDGLMGELSALSDQLSARKKKLEARMSKEARRLKARMEMRVIFFPVAGSP
jgi:hypothetical protein